MLWLLACTGRPTVAVVGAGPAGLAAAIEAAASAQVTLYEGEGQVGGSLRYANAITTFHLPGVQPAPARYREQVDAMVVQWTTGLGASWSPAPGATSDQPLMWPNGGGHALVGALERAARDAGVDIRLNTRVEELPSADAVIVATGGIMGDVQAFRDWAGLDPELELLRGAPEHADGNGLLLLEQAARHAPKWLVYPHGTPGPHGVAKMVLGAEGMATDDGTLLQGPRGDQGNAWALAPKARSVTVTGPHVALLDWENQRVTPVKKGATLDLVPTTAKQLSGVQTDLAGRVLDASGEPIPGLYAAGELTGFHDAYAEHIEDSTMVAGAILTGRVAAQTALADR